MLGSPAVPAWSGLEKTMRKQLFAIAFLSCMLGSAEAGPASFTYHGILTCVGDEDKVAAFEYYGSDSGCVVSIDGKRWCYRGTGTTKVTRARPQPGLLHLTRRIGPVTCTASPPANVKITAARCSISGGINGGRGSCHYCTPEKCSISSASIRRTSK